MRPILCGLAVSVPVVTAVSVRIAVLVGVGTVRAEPSEHLLGEFPAVAWVHGRADDPNDDVVAVELLDRDVRRGAKRGVGRLLDLLLHPAGGRVGGERGAGTHPPGVPR